MTGITPAGIAVQVSNRLTRRAARVDPPTMVRSLVGLLKAAGLSSADIARIGRQMPASKSAAHRAMAGATIPTRPGDDDGDDL